MQIIPTNMTVSDYCEAMLRKDIIVNHKYQRSDKVWPPAARSFLIETILLHYSVPKLSLFQVTDLKSKKTYKEIIDGQQRSSAILDFYQDKLRLPKTSEIEDVANRTFSQLSPEYQQKFLEFSISIDLFVSATPEQIREVFRRINSYTVPLNAEEKRHAVYQGEFKWFVYQLSKRHDENLINMGVFVEKQLVRQADTKLFAEIVHSMLNGIATTTAPTLDKLYKTHDSDFPQQRQMDERIDNAVEFLLGLQEIHKTAMMKPFLFYSLVLAASHMQNPIETLLVAYTPHVPYIFNREVVLTNLTTLSETLENDSEVVDDKLEEFYEASLKTTNDAKRRKVIFKWVCRAFEPVLL
ncbi:MAG: DUF262 domain-containing protein [Chloroflexi bacterium]|nr:DUF262 domain-containing protein [Chloroflexota bacterium]